MNDLLSMWMMHLTQELFLEGDQAPVEVDVGEVRKASKAIDILGSAGGIDMAIGFCYGPCIGIVTCNCKIVGIHFSVVMLCPFQ